MYKNLQVKINKAVNSKSLIFYPIINLKKSFIVTSKMAFLKGVRFFITHPLLQNPHDAGEVDEVLYVVDNIKVFCSIL